MFLYVYVIFLFIVIDLKISVLVGFILLEWEVLKIIELYKVKDLFWFIDFKILSVYFSCFRFMVRLCDN